MSFQYINCLANAFRKRQTHQSRILYDRKTFICNKSKFRTPGTHSLRRRSSHRNAYNMPCTPPPFSFLLFSLPALQGYSYSRRRRLPCQPSCAVFSPYFPSFYKKGRRSRNGGLFNSDMLTCSGPRRWPWHA